MTNDLSMNTAVISLVIALVGWGLKTSIVSLIGYLKTNIKEMAELNTKIVSVMAAVERIPKLELDMNHYYTRLRAVERDLVDITDRAQ